MSAAPLRRIVEPMRAEDLVPFLLGDGPVGFALANLNPRLSGPIVCISDDPQWGKLWITIQNNTDQPITVDERSRLSVFMASLLSGDEVRAIKVDDSRWSGSAQPDGRGGVYLQLQPKGTIALDPETPIGLELTNVLAAETDTPTTGHFRFQYSGFQGTRDAGRRVTVLLQNPPSAKGRPWPLHFSFDPRPQYGPFDRGDTTYVTIWSPPEDGPKVENELVLRIENTGDAPIPLPEKARPAINVSFVSGDTQSCICTDEQINGVIGGIALADTRHQWKFDKDDETPTPLWTLAPDPSAGNPNFLDPDGVVAVRFSALWTDLPPNFAAPVFIQFAGLHDYGFDDGYAVRLVRKLPPQPYATEFRLYAGDTPLAPDAAAPYGPLTLKWNVFAAQRCVLAGTFVPLSTASSLPVAPAQQLRYTLQAQAGMNIRSIASVAATVTPPTAALSVDRKVVAPKDSVTLTWSCGNGDHCRLLANGTQIADQLKLCDRRVVEVDVRTDYTIVCVGVGTAQATVTVTFASIDAGIEVNGFSPPHRGNDHWAATISWWTRNAATCSIVVAETGQFVSSALSGNQVTVRGQDSSYRVTFRLTAVGDSTITREAGSR